MKNRLDELLNGQFEYEIPRMQLSGRNISLTAGKGESAKGAFLITHPKDGRVRGFLQTDNPRIRLSKSEFFGHENIVRFFVDTEGMEAGESTEGNIKISSDLGEETVHVITSVPADEKPADLPDEEQLAALAEKDFDHAAAIFSSEEYRQVMERASSPSKALYLGLMSEKDPCRRLEEFLIGTGHKESVDISCDWTRKKITDPEGTIREILTLTASGWGYLEISISSDAHFLRPEKKKITTHDFIGNSCEIGLIIDSNFLHAGKNYGKVTIRTPYRTMDVVVRVSRTGDGEARRLHRVRKLMRKKAAFLYLDYRTGKIDLHNWAGRTESVLNAYRRAGGQDVYADLFSIFVLQADGRRREAERLLADLEKDLGRLTTPDRYAFLLFLTTFFTRDSDYINEVRAAVRRLSIENQGSWKIRWVCLYLLEDDLLGDSGRLDAVLTQIARGCNSPFLYLEGALVLRKDPFLLHEIGPEMRLVLNFASKYDLLTEQNYLSIASMEKRKPHYDPVIFRILGRYADRSGAADALEALCAMAIEGGKKSREYFPLYRAAVMKEASVTGLYEYYMEAMDECRIETMPEVIRRYFVYNDTLDYHKKARIFRNMADSREQIPGIFRSMRPSIGKFLIGQLAQSHIDNDLAALYSEFLQKQMLTDRLASSLIRLLFTYRIECLSPGMKKIILADSRLNGERETMLRNSAALVCIYSDETRILLEDEEGKRYSSTSLYMADHLLESQELLDMCASLVPDSPELTLLYTLNTGKTHPVDSQNLRFFRKAEGMRVLTEEYRRKIRSWLLDYYYDHTDDLTLETFLRHIDPSDYADAGLFRLQSLLTGEGFYEEAYRLVLRYGHDRIPVSLLVRICSQMVIAAEYQEDDRLLADCAFCFFSGKYDKNVLTYLSMYFDGTIGDMKKLWKVSKQYGLDTMKLEEKILSLIIFEREQGEGSEEICLSYKASLGRRKLCMAIEVFRCWEYFVKGETVPDSFFRDMALQYAGGGDLPDVCGLALLKNLAYRRDRSEPEDESAKKLLGDFEDRGILFSFFREYPEEFHSEAGIFRKVFFEYTADPESRVKLSFRPKDSGDPWTEEVMKDMAFGVRVRTFALLSGEKLECFTEEERKDGTRIFSGIRTLEGRPVLAGEEDTRYGMLSGLSEAVRQGDKEEASRILLRLRQMDALTEELFTIL